MSWWIVLMLLNTVKHAPPRPGVSYEGKVSGMRRIMLYVNIDRGTPKLSAAEGWYLNRKMGMGRGVSALLLRPEAGKAGA